MEIRTFILVAAMGSLLGAAAAKPVPYTLVQPAQYQSFVANWTPENRPLYAAIESAAQWNRIFRPAAVMGAHAPFAPPTSFWQKHALLAIARVVNAGDTSHVFHVESVTIGGDAMRVRYRFTPTPTAASTMKWWIGIAVDKPLPKAVGFVENGRIAQIVQVDEAAPTGQH